MKIAGVSIDLENLPTKEQMHALAINTKEFESNPLRDEQIEKILNDSGLWKVKKVVEPKIEEDGLHTTVAKKDKRDKR